MYDKLPNDTIITVKMFDNKGTLTHRRRRVLLGSSSVCCAHFTGADPLYVWLPMRQPRKRHRDGLGQLNLSDQIPDLQVSPLPTPLSQTIFPSPTLVFTPYLASKGKAACFCNQLPLPACSQHLRRVKVGATKCAVAGTAEVSVGDGGDEGAEHPHGAVPRRASHLCHGGPPGRALQPYSGQHTGQHLLCILSWCVASCPYLVRPSAACEPACSTGSLCQCLYVCYTDLCGADLHFLLLTHFLYWECALRRVTSHVSWWHCLRCGAGQWAHD